MQITCPCCYARFPLEAALEDAAAREALAHALKLPQPLGDLMVRYLALFRPAKHALSWKRVSKLLGELLPMIQVAEITRKGVTWSAPVDYWKLAFEDVLNRREKLTLPLTGHGYLLEIIAGLANKAAGKEETRIESDRQHQSRTRGKSQPRNIADIIEQQRREQWDRELAERAGLTVKTGD